MSKISWIFIGFSLAGLILAYFTDNKALMLYSIIILALIYIAAEFIGHRGFVHSIACGLIASGALLIVFGYSIKIALLGFVCFYSHLVADKEPFKMT
jgi:membrane-bound metal-dependent hydrolase YbcI (DUF457 family)